MNNTVNLIFEDRERFYEVHLPSGYDENKPNALVLNFHGGGGSPSDQRTQSKMDEVSDRHGFIVVYPAGTGIEKNRNLFFNAGNVYGYARENNVNDIGFVESIINDLENRFNIDKKRIFATGFSNGAKFCYLLADRLSHLIAAIGPVSGTMAFPKSECHPKRPVSVIHFHGTLDPINPCNGGKGPFFMKIFNKTPVYNTPVEDTINCWIELNGCPEKPCKTSHKGNAVCETYGPGKDNSEVILWTLRDGGHTWPGGNRTLPEIMVSGINNDISASELIWEFFRAHPMK